uniref:Uncharacterized protein n=1 Tax=Setaria digitata TaxID=48799 RepID=A0A915Q3V0_9BILA
MTEVIHQGRLLAIFTIFVAIGIGSRSVAGAARRTWTEQDEARRIQQIMEAEEMEYEMEQRSQSSAVADGEVNVPRESLYNYPVTESFQNRKETVAPVTLPSVTVTTSGILLRAIEKFLRIRRTAYPVHVKSARCSEPRNLTELAVEHCRHPYCQTLILTDHDTGSAFTMRGCAETFGAINEKLLDARDDNTCQRLHEQLDIRECICRHRRYCYPGVKRTLFSASAATFMASAPADNVISTFYSILLIFLTFTFYDHF